MLERQRKGGCEDGVRGEWEYCTYNIHTNPKRRWQSHRQKVKCILQGEYICCRLLTPPAPSLSLSLSLSLPVYMSVSRFSSFLSFLKHMLSFKTESNTTLGVRLVEDSFILLKKSCNRTSSMKGKRIQTK